MGKPGNKFKDALGAELPSDKPSAALLRASTRMCSITIRTTKKTVTFRRPFVLRGFDEVLPAGAYHVEIDEELLEGISFPVYRRLLALIDLHPKPGHPGLRQTLTIDPKDLEAALKRDQSQVEENSNP